MDEREEFYDICINCGAVKSFIGTCPNCSSSGYMSQAYTWQGGEELVSSPTPYFNQRYAVLVFDNGKELSFIENPGTQPDIQKRVNSADRILLSNDKEKALNYLDEEMQKRQENGY